jgi:hypothetical protein
MSTPRDCSGGPIGLGTRRIAQVIEPHDTNHYVFIVDEALVVRETRTFLLEE